MTVLRRQLRILLHAEEIPRAIGLMLVLVFVIAVGGVSLVTYLHQQNVAQAHVTATFTNAVGLLADRLESSEARPQELQQRLLRQFSARYPCRVLRVYGEPENVLASLEPAEIGHVHPAIAADIPAKPKSTMSCWVESGANHPALLVRTALRPAGAAETWYLEALHAPDTELLGGGLPITALAVALSATAALLVVYRRLRRDMATVTRIADHLLHSADQLPESLVDLRIAGPRDRVAECWNRLVDFTIRLNEEVARSNASSELVAALSRGDGGDLAAAMTSAPIGVMLFSDERQVSYANAMVRRVIGWPVDGPLPLSTGDEGISEDGRRIIDCITRCALSGSAARTLDAQVEGTDSSFYQVQVIPAGATQQSSRLLALVTDVSQQVRADKAREEFVSQVTHELRTPLTNIRAYTETLSSGMFDDPQVITECYNVITKETRRLSRLVEDILSVSQLEVGTMQLVIDDVDIRALLNDAVRDVRGIAESKTIDLQVVLPPKLPDLKADRDKLAVVINNLLGNALKYTPAGGHVTLSCKATGAHLQIAVRDDGIGIDPKDHGKIFEKFQRADDAAVLAETGTGIGLTTAREIVLQHGGEIAVVSRKGEGATFTVSIPLQNKGRAAIAAAESATV